MEFIDNELKQWENKSQNIIKIGLLRENIIHANINNYEIKIDCNEYRDKRKLNIKYNQDENLEWLSTVDLYCCTKKPSLKKLLKKIEKEFIKNDIVSKNNMLDKNKLEIEELKLKDKLLKNLQNNDNILSTETEKKNIYEKKTIDELLVNQYLSVYKKFTDKNIVIEPINDKVNNLRIKFYKFEKEELNKQINTLKENKNIDHIEITITFNNELYPIYPPVIKYIKPILKHQRFIYQLSSLKMINSNYWIPTRTLEFIINKLYTILNTHCEINTEFSENSKTEYHEFEIIFSELFSLYDFSSFKGYQEIDTEKYTKIYSGEKISNSKPKYWRSGVGYGHGSKNSWNIDNFMKIQKENDNRKHSILGQIYMSIEKNLEYNFYDIVNESMLINYFITLLEGINIMEVSKHKKVYDIVFNILKLLSKNKNSNIIKLIYTKNNNDLYYHLSKINQIVTVYKSFNKDDNTYDFITQVFDIISKQAKDIQVHDSKLSMKLVLNDISKNKDEDLNKRYYNSLKEFSFRSFPISRYSKYAYLKSVSSAKFTNRKLLKSINKEYIILMDPIINIDSSIFFTFDDECMVCMQALITGPKDTPYDSGCLIFDILIPNDYPNSPPNVLFKNNGGMRFNPNLYDKGKVCLSLLGTWYSGKDEGWIPNLSTIKQVGISIQSLILVENPFFNEPSYEKSMNTPKGDKNNDAYNMKIKLYNMRHTIYETFNNPPEPFKDIILKHFELKKDYVLKMCKEWVDYSKDYDNKNKTKYYDKYKSIYEKILKLYN